MKLRTYLFVAALLGALVLLTFVALNNLEVIDQPFVLWGETSVSVGTLLVSAFLLGAGLTLLLGVVREAGSTIERWRRRRADRRSEEIEEEYSRGLAAILEGRDEQALKHLRAVLERDSKHFNTLLKIGEVMRGQKRFDEAIEYHRKAQHLKEGDTRPRHALVEDYEAMGETERARSVLDEIIRLDDNSVSAWRKLRSLYIKERDWDKALAADERVSKLTPVDATQRESDLRTSHGVRYEIACARLEAGKHKEAIHLLRRLLKENRQFLPAHLKLGEALLAANQEDEAVQAWYSGFETTGSPIFLTALENHYLEREQPLAAIEALKGCVAKARKEIVPRFYLGKLYFRLEMLDDAFSVLTALENRTSYAPTLHYLLGRIHERRHQFTEAAAEYRRVIREMELVRLDYKCQACSETSEDWHARCDHCGEWNSIQINFREEIPLEELGIAPAPIYSAQR